MAQRLSPAELVRYTFDALQAWAQEQGFGRQQDQTPLEFGRLVGGRVKAVSREANQLAQLYARLAYANKSPKRDALQVLERLWRRMSAPDAIGM